MLMLPFLDKIETNSKGIVDTQKESSRLVMQTVELTKFENSLDQYQSDLDKINSIFIDGDTPLEFIQLLEITALESNARLEISSIVTPAIKTEEWMTLTFNVVLDGSFNDLMRFLEKLEFSNYLIQIEDLVITLDNSEESIRMTSSIKLLAK